MLARPPAFKALIAGGGLVLPHPSAHVCLPSQLTRPPSQRTPPTEPSQSAALAAVAVTVAGGVPAFILKAKYFPLNMIFDTTRCTND
jgi:hypothetical protein